MSERPVIDFATAVDALDDDAAERLPGRHELERLLAGELSEERAAEVQKCVDDNPALQAKLQDLRAEHDAFSTQIPFGRFEARLQDELQPATSSTSFFDKLRNFFLSPGGMGSFAAVGAAALLFTLMPVDGAGPNRTKGGDSRISFFVKSDQGARLGTDGEQLREGQQVQFALRDDIRAKSVVVVGIDGRGSVSTFVAQTLETTSKGAAATPATPNKQRLLPESIILDDAVGAERFFVVYSNLDAAAAERAVTNAAKRLVTDKADLKAITRLDVDAVSQSSVHIVKVSSTP